MANKMGLVKYPDANAKLELVQLSNDYKDLVVTKKNLPEGKIALRTIRDKRYEIQNIRDENKSVLNELKRKNNSRADEYIALISETEESLGLKVKVVVDELEAEKERKRKARELKLQQQKERSMKLNEYSGRILECKTEAEAKLLIKIIDGIRIFKKEYGPYYDEALVTKEKIMDQAIAYRLKLKELEGKKEEVIPEEKPTESAPPVDSTEPTEKPLEGGVVAEFDVAPEQKQESAKEEKPVEDTPKTEEQSFLDYIKETRAAFAATVALYSTDDNLKLRTESDNLLIAYDQMMEKIKG